MAEYIEREVLHQSLKKLADETDCNIAVLPDVADLIREAPAADVAPVKHGRWKLENDYQSRCTNCQKTSWVDHDDEPNYCPHCGARMDEEAKAAMETWKGGEG